MEQTITSFAPLSPETNVYRAESKKHLCDFDAGRLLFSSFRMRKADFERGDGLSMIVYEKCPSPNEAQNLTGRSNIKAVGALTVGAIQALNAGLEVIQDGDYHAGIHGLPFTEDENDLATLKLMDDFAEALAELSTICSSI